MRAPLVVAAVAAVVAAAAAPAWPERLAFEPPPQPQHGHHAGPAEPAAPCDGADALDYACLERRYLGLVTESGVPAAFADLHAAYGASGYVRGVCHDLVHAIGHAAGARLGDLVAAFTVGDPLCSGGYYHGVTEAVMTTHERPPPAMTVCKGLQGPAWAPIERFYCAHGMGHGYLALAGGDLRPALAACDGLSDRTWRRACHGGVFMENITGAGDPLDPVTALRPEEPLYPCTAVAAAYQPVCFEKQTAYALLLAGADFGAVFAQCAVSAEAAALPACWAGLGDHAVVRSARLRLGSDAIVVSVRALCGEGGERALPDCAAGAAATVIRHGHGIALGNALCAAFGDDPASAACTGALDDATRLFGPVPAR